MDHLKDNIYLVPASLKDYPVIQNMARFYVYDISAYMEDDEEWAIPDNGLFECLDFRKYWEDKQAFPFIVRWGKEIAGFVIVDKKGSDPKVNFNMAQFFILRRFQNKGIGRLVAHLCFERFKGIWEVMVLPRNMGAFLFWEKVIADYTNAHFEQYTRSVKHLNYSEKKIFRFKT